jgi:hypothetical protein
LELPEIFQVQVFRPGLIESGQTGEKFCSCISSIMRFRSGVMRWLPERNWMGLLA